MPQRDETPRDSEAMEALLQRAGELATLHRERRAALSGLRDKLRTDGAALLGSLAPVALGTARCAPLRSVAVDGAHIADVDRGSAYSVSAAVAVPSDGPRTTSHCLAVLPHLASLPELSAGLMFMQEVMLYVEAAEADPKRLVLIDGSRVSTVIALDMFYTAFATQRPEYLKTLRRHPTGDPGSTVAKFESSDWVGRFMLAPNIVGNAKMVSARRLVKALDPGADRDPLMMTLDDKLVATLVLATPDRSDGGEGIGPFPMDPPRSPLRLRGVTAKSPDNGYPFHLADAVDVLRSVPAPPDRRPPPEAIMEGEKLGLFAFYANPTPMHGAFCLEVNAFFFGSPLAELLSIGMSGDSDQRALRGLAAWVRDNTPSPDVQEPYLNHVADRLVKESVTAAHDILQAIVAVTDEDDWNLTRSHRTSK